MRYKDWSRIGLFALGLLLLGERAWAEQRCAADKIHIIMNSVSASAMSGFMEFDQGVVKSLFLKEKTSWGNGSKINVLTRHPSSKAGDLFMLCALNMDFVAWDRHWDKNKHLSEPSKVASTRSLLRRIKKDKNAIGYLLDSDIDYLTDQVSVVYTLTF